MNRCAFTICAKNYLAQALTLQGSFKRHNSNIDFFIFLSDKGNNELIKEIPNLVLVDTKIVPKLEEMAFKYNVTEFSTSIKPFCINNLFNQYEKVIYLDPDIYVTSPLNEIYGWLDEKDMVLTPHYNHIKTEYDGAEAEEELLFVGIYNLGFCAVKKSGIGRKIIAWWMNRLENKCFAEKSEALHVDQKWINFLPAFFPDNILITRHQGCNVAIWNLHEREIIAAENNYLVKDLVTNDIKPLLFFHFSGLDINNEKIIHRSFKKHTTDVYPSVKEIKKEYIQKAMDNKFDYYSGMRYDFNFYSNDKRILLINRRLYRRLFCGDEKPFSADGAIYKAFKKNNLISKQKSEDGIPIVKNMEKKKNIALRLFALLLKFILRILGVDRYVLLLRLLQKMSREDLQAFLVKDKDI